MDLRQGLLSIDAHFEKGRTYRGNDVAPLKELRTRVGACLALGGKLSHKDLTDLQHRFAEKTIANWSDTIDMKPVYIKDDRAALDLQGKYVGKVPIEGNLSVRDNLYVLFRYLELYYRGTFDGCFENSSDSSDGVASSYKDLASKAITTGIAYHFLVFDTITEGCSIDLDSLETQDLQKRISSAYGVITKLSSTMNHSVLVMLDDLSTMTMKSPFILNKETNEVFLKREVLDMLCLASRLVNSMKKNSPDIQTLFQELNKKVFEYTGDHQTFQNIMESLEQAKVLDHNDIHGCPAHGVETSDGSLFRSLYFVSIESFRTYYEFLRKNKPELIGKQDKIGGSGTEKDVMSLSVMQILNKVYGVGKKVVS